MLKKEMLENIVFFQCYLESKNNNKHIKKVLKKFKEFFPDLEDKEPYLYNKCTQLIHTYPLE